VGYVIWSRILKGRESSENVTDHSLASHQDATFFLDGSPGLRCAPTLATFEHPSGIKPATSSQTAGLFALRGSLVMVFEK
jgi:hypothetical protein